MATNWNSLATKVRLAIKDDFPEEMTISVTQTDTSSSGYSITNGKPTASVPVTYRTNGVIKSFDIEEFANVSPEEVEILFHIGFPSNPIPDLSDEQDIQITAYGKIYKVSSLRAVRPGGVTLIYKAIAKESKDAN